MVSGIFERGGQKGRTAVCRARRSRRGP